MIVASWEINKKLIESRNFIAYTHATGASARDLNAKNPENASSPFWAALLFSRRILPFAALPYPEIGPRLVPTLDFPGLMALKSVTKAPRGFER